MSSRSPTAPQPGVASSRYQPVNVYINYRTPSEASHCIAATDGTVTSEGNKLKAVWGTTRYCPNYLKGIRCHLENCNLAHEAGEEIEGAAPSTKDEIFTLYVSSSLFYYCDVLDVLSSQRQRDRFEAETLFRSDHEEAAGTVTSGDCLVGFEERASSALYSHHPQPAPSPPFRHPPETTSSSSRSYSQTAPPLFPPKAGCRRCCRRRCSSSSSAR